jgi:hypothetical protein
MRPDAGRADLLDLSSVEAVLFDMAFGAMRGAQTVALRDINRAQ